MDNASGSDAPSAAPAGELALPPKKKFGGKWSAKDKKAAGTWKWGRVTPEVVKTILERAITGMSYRDISDTVQAIHSVTVDFGRIGQIVREHRAEREEMAKAITRRELSRFIVSDLELLTTMTRQGEELLHIQHDAQNSREWTRIAEQLRKLIETRLHFLGIDTRDTTDLRKLSDAEFNAMKSALLSALTPQPAPPIDVPGVEVKS